MKIFVVGKKSWIPVIVLLIAASAVLLAHGCRKTSTGPINSPKIKNVLLISIDTLRADHVGSYGYQPPTTPTLDAFAQSAVRFKNMFAASPWTSPSHASMFTGLYPMVHGVVLIKKRLNENIMTLAQVLKKYHYQNLAVVCAPFLNETYQLNRGFDVYDTDLTYPRVKQDASLAFAVTEKGLNYLDQLENGPFFLFLHYWDPPHPYNPDDRYVQIFDPDYDGDVNGYDIRERPDMVPGMNPRDLHHLISLYDAEIRYTDEAIGALLDGLRERGLDKNTMIIITSDHGEEFLDHGGRAHLAQCWNETVKVPLLVRIPWLDHGKREVDDLASHVDFFPTVLDFLGYENDLPQVDGISLRQAIEYGKPLPKRNVFSQTSIGRITNDRSGPGGDWTVMMTPEMEKLHNFENRRDGFIKLFDLEKDLAETNDLSGERPARTKELKETEELLQQQFSNKKKAIRAGDDFELDPDFDEKLKSLGYVN